jgi:hypothetical protein
MLTALTSASLPSPWSAPWYRDGVREELDARFAATIAAADGARARREREGWPPFALPAPLRESIAAAAARHACPPALIAHYTERMPRMLIEQSCPDDEPRRLLCRPLDLARLPRLRAALDGLFAALHTHGLDAPAFVGCASAAQLIAARPSLAAIYAHTLFGSGLPLVGAYPADAPALAADLGRLGPDETLDRRLGCHIVHELCHGPPARQSPVVASWMVAEAAANHLGAAARTADVFPDEAGEGLRAVALFVVLGEVLARHFGAANVWRVSLGVPLAELFGAAVADALERAAWEDWQARQEPPFARDALAVGTWLKLVDAARAGLPLGERPLATANCLSWQTLPWWQAPVSRADEEMLPRALTALFQVNALAPDFRTLPAELPQRRLWIDVAEARLFAEPRPNGVYAEPAWWIMPPPLARRLFERGARRLRIDGATRARRQVLAAALRELCAGSGPLAVETELRWDCSR